MIYEESYKDLVNLFCQVFSKKNQEKWLVIIIMGKLGVLNNVMEQNTW